MCGAFSAYIGRATPQQACCPFACCCTPTQPQTVSHMFLECPVAATVVSWLCRLWQAMTGHTPDASVASILVASTQDGHCASNALLQTWHRLRLAVLHSIWTAARITASSTKKSRCVRQESWCHPIVRFEAAQQARFIGSDTPRGSNLLAKQASFLAWYLLFSAKQQAGSSGCLHKE